MILHRIAATNVGPFVGPSVTAGPFAPGLNILSAPNETGKTTLLKAAGRALFDRHTCKADEIRNLRPAGTTLAPAVTVEFETREGRFQIEKTFLQSPRSHLSERDGGSFRPVADGDGADDRLNALLQSTKPGRGATDAAAHWGMLGYLWMRQGELAEWPEWHKATAGPLVQGMLVKVELDPFIRSVGDRMWSVFTENFTPATNQPKVGGTLLAAEGELTRVEAELAEVARTRQQIGSDQDAFDQHSGEQGRLQEEHTRCRQQADALREAAGQVRVLQAEADGCRQALETARARLKAVQQDESTLRDHARQLEDLAARLGRAQEEAARLTRAGGLAQETLQAVETRQEDHARLLAGAQALLARAREAARRRRLADEVVRTARTLEQCAAQEATLVRLTAERGEIPTVSPAKLARLEKLHESIQSHRARLEALGLKLELVPAGPSAPVVVQRDGAPPETLGIAPGGQCVVHATQTVTLDLPGWGTVRLRSGAGETRSVRETLSTEEDTFRRELGVFGVPTLAAARDLAGRARDLDREIESARQALASLTGGTGETLDALRARFARDRRQLELLSAEATPTPAEGTGTAAELDAAEEAASGRCDDRQQEAKSLERQARECRERLAAATGERDRAERAALLLQAETESLRRQAAAVQARHAGGLEESLTAAHEGFGAASYALKQAEAKLPADAAALPERSRRAEAAAQQVGAALDRCQASLAELRGRLELQGSSGLHGREGTLLARRDALRVQVTQARSRSRAARLVHDLIARRQGAATRAVLAPLQERLGARFAEVSGERDRRIFLDESLTVRGLGRKDGELVPFGDLSQGAKEQLLLCLRLAIAEELMAGGGGAQSLILDDVLVNTDVARQERVLSLLGDATARGLQILVCTCHPDRYRGAGEIITLRRE